MHKSSWEKLYNSETDRRSRTWPYAMGVGAFFILFLAIFGMMAAFILVNWANPITVTINVLFVLVLLGVLVATSRLLRPRRVIQTPLEKDLQNVFEAVTAEIGFDKKVIFLLDNEYNAFATRKFGIFGQRIVCVGMPILLTRDYNAIKFIIGHEIAHLVSNDNFLSGLSWLTLDWIETFVSSVNPFTRKGPEQNNIVFFLAKILLGFVGLLVLPFALLLRYLCRKVSHEMEYQADLQSMRTFGTESATNCMKLLGYLEYFGNNYHEYPSESLLVRFLSWIPIPESTSLAWIKKSTESFSHPSVQTRFDLAIRLKFAGKSQLDISSDLENILARYGQIDRPSLI